MGDLAEDETTLREADEHASRWLVDPTSVDADSASVALDLASRHAGQARIAQLLTAARGAKTREDRILALRALGGFDDPVMLQRALDATLTEDIPPHEMRYALGSAFGRRGARLVAEAWVRANWDELRKKLPGSLSAGLITAVGVGCTKAELEERKAFYVPRAADIEGASRPLAEAIEASSLCAELRGHAARSLTRELLNREKRN